MIAVAGLFASLSLGLQHGLYPGQPFGSALNAVYWAIYLAMATTSGLFLVLTGRRSENVILLDLGRHELGFTLTLFGILLTLCLADLRASLDLSAYIMGCVALCTVMRVAPRVQLITVVLSVALLISYLLVEGKIWAVDGIVDALVFGVLSLLVGLGLEREFRRMMSYKLSVATQTQQLREVSVRDPLGGLYSSGYARIFLEQQMQNAARQRYPLSVIAVAIDRWSEIAKSNPVESELLGRAVSELLGNGIRQSDIAAILDDEGFLLVLPATARAGCLAVAERFRRRTAKISAAELGAITASFGLAQWDGQDAPDALLVQAISRMHQARDAGGNRIVA